MKHPDEPDISRAQFRSPVGLFTILAGDDGIQKIEYAPLEVQSTRPTFLGLESEGPITEPTNALGHLKLCLRELDAFFFGELADASSAFETRINSAMNAQVVVALRRIPFGETRTLAEIGIELANVANPCPILVPCHRVLDWTESLAGTTDGEVLRGKLRQFEASVLGQDGPASRVAK